MKRILCLILGILMLSGTFSLACAEENIKIFLNGEEVTTDVAPQLINDRTMVPVRFIFEALGANVSWDEATNTAKGNRTGIEISITIGENVFYRNGKAVSLDSPAVVVNDRTLVPVRAIAESFNCNVEWNGEENSVIITTDEIIFGISPDIPPFSYMSGGKITGADIEIAVEIADRMGKTPVFVVYDYNELHNALSAGNVDLIISGTPLNETGTAYFDASESYYHSKLILVTNLNSTVELDKLKGRKIGVLKNTVAQTYVNFDMDGFRVYEYDNTEEMFEDLKKVDIACVIGDENTLSGKTDDFSIYPEAYSQEDFVIYTQKNNDELLNKINECLSNMKDDSVLDRILNAYIKK